MREAPLLSTGDMDLVVGRYHNLATKCGALMKHLSRNVPMSSDMSTLLLRDSKNYAFRGNRTLATLPRYQIEYERSVASQPDLVELWSPLNALPPEAVLLKGSHEDSWWRCKRGHEWPAKPINIFKGGRCPFCSGRYATPEINLAVIFPKLAAFWHPTKNATAANTFTPKSNKVAWFICKKGHEWKSKINNLARWGTDPRCRWCEPHATRKNASFPDGYIRISERQPEPDSAGQLPLW